LILGLCGIREHFAELFGAQANITIAVTTVQSDDSNLALTQAKWRLAGTGSNAHLRGAEIAKSIFKLRHFAHAIDATTPPSTLSAAPVVADESGEAM
jgi:hypothetical protein